MAALALASGNAFEARMEAYLRESFSAHIGDIKGHALRDRVRDGITSANSHGLHLEYDVRRYLEHMLIHEWSGQAGDEPPWAREILSSKNMDGTARMDLIDDYSMHVLKK